jgi:hypothetical protein
MDITALLEFKRVLKSHVLLAVSAPNAALAVRIPLRLTYWMTRPLGQYRYFAFLDYSRHAWSGKCLAATLESCGLVPMRIVPFGSLDLFGLRLSITPSLLMAVAEK